MISQRTKDALTAAKRRGKVLGGNRGVTPSRKMQAASRKALQEHADQRAQRQRPDHPLATGRRENEPAGHRAKTHDRGIPTASGNGQWTAPAGDARTGTARLVPADLNDIKSSAECDRGE
jgi:hypothetical protein